MTREKLIGMIWYGAAVTLVLFIAGLVILEAIEQTF